MWGLVLQMLQMCQMKSWAGTRCVLWGDARALPVRLSSLIIVSNNRGWCVGFIRLAQILPAVPQRKGVRAADKRCGLAAVEIWTSILIAIARRPTFPVGAIMALLRGVCCRERLVHMLLRFSIFGCESMKSECAGAAMATRRTWINRAGSVRTLLALWFLGNMRAHSSLFTVLLTGRHFLLKVAQAQKNHRRATVQLCGSDLQLCT